MKTTFNDGTLSINADKQTGWAFQFYFPKFRIERVWPTKDRVVGFNMQFPTALRWHWSAQEIALGCELIGFGFAVQLARK